MSSHPPRAFSAATTNFSSDSPTLLERIRALDRSKELSHRYTALILFYRTTCKSDSYNGAAITAHDNSSSYVAVGHAETSFIESTLLHCKNERGEPVFVKDEFPNKHGIMTGVLRLNIDVQTQKDTEQIKDVTTGIGGGCIHQKLFQERTIAFEHVTNHLLSSGVVSRKHSDVYPIIPFVKSTTSCIGGRSKNDDGQVALAHVNRSTAPYLGIDSVGVHLHCYVCGQDDKDAGSGISGVEAQKPSIKGLWLAKRAPTKSHHPNYWDPTVAGGQPANLSIIDNIIKEAHEEAGIPAEWIRSASSDIVFSDHTHDPLTISTAKPDGTCLKRSLYYSCDLQVPHKWNPVPVDGEVSEFKLYTMKELEEELRFGNSVRPAMRAVLLDFMMRHSVLNEGGDFNELRDAMRRERMALW